MARRKATPARRFVRSRGGSIEIGVGLLLASFVQAREAAAAAGVSQLDGESLTHPEAALPDALAAIDPDSIETLTPEELRQLLDAKALAQLGLDAGEFSKLLDEDLEEALRQLESAFRKKLKLLAAGEASKVADADIRAAAHDGEAGHDADYESALGDGSPLLLIIGGLAAAGLGVALAGGGGSDDDDGPASPVATNDTVAATEDTPVTFDVRTNDSDANGDALSVTHINGTAITATAPVAITGGSISLGADGRLTFTPTANFNGAPSFQYTISDGHGGTATATANLAVAAVNDAPVNTVPQDVAANQGEGIQIGGLAIADVDAAGTITTTISAASGSLTAGAVTGGATVNGDGTGTLTLTGTVAQINATLSQISFNGGPNFFGQTTLTITTNDGQASDVDTIDISVARVIDGIVQDGYIAGATVFIDVDGDGELDEGEPSTVTDADGNFLLTSNLPGLIVAIGGTNTDTGLANTIPLKAPAGATVVSPITTLVAEMVRGGASVEEAKAAVAEAFGIPASIDVTSFDFLAPTDDPELAEIAIAVQKSATQIVTVLATAQEAATGGSGSAVQAAVLAKLVAAVSAGGSVDLTDVAIIGQMLSGVDGLPASVVQQVTVQVTAVNQTIATATSAQEIANTVVTLTEDGADLPPITVTDLVSAIEDGGAVSFNVIANDLDDRGEVISLRSVNGTAVQPGMVVVVPGGTISVGEGGQLTFTPTADFHGEPSFKYTIADSAGNVQTGTVKLDVAGVNDAPTANADSISTLQNSAITFDPRANDGDVDGDTLQVTHVDGNAISVTSPVAVEGGIVSLGTDGRLTFTPASGYVGTPGFSYTVSDGNGGTSTSRVDANVLEPSNAGPVAAADTINASEDAPVTFDVRINDTDANGDPLVVTHINGVVISLNSPVVTDQGTFRMDEAGALTFAPAVNFNGTVSFTYRVVDGRGGSSNGAGEITVASVNDVPLTANDSFTTAEDAPVTINVRGNDGDVDGGTLAVTHVNGTPITVDTPVAVAGGVVSLVAGNLVFTPSTNFNGSPSFTYTVSDGQGGSSTATVSGTVVADHVLQVSAADFAQAVSDIGSHAAAGIETIDVIGDSLAVTDAQAGLLLGAGVDFAEADTITVHAAGTHLGTSLKGLQQLHVDSVAVIGGELVLDAGGGLGDLSASNLPQFIIAQSDADADVTLNIGAGALGSGYDLAALAGSLAGAGIDHIGVNGNGRLNLSHSQALGLNGAGLDFVDSADITVSAGALDLAGFNPAVYDQLNVDHIDVNGGGAATISDGQASALLNAGVDFVEADTITVQASGTHLSTSLKGLQQLHVDSVAVTGGTLVVEAGGALSGIAASGLPQFDVAQTGAALDVTLNVTGGVIGNGFDLEGVVRSLAEAGVDHLGVTGNGALALTLAQAETIAAAGLDFANGAQVTVSLGSDALAGLDTALLDRLNIDHVDVTGAGVATISDAQAGAMLGAGVDFVEADTITIQASGTHLSTSLKGLQQLHVDSISAPGAILAVDAGGGLDGLSSSGLPQFDIAQSDAALDVTLNVAAGSLAGGADIGSLATALAGAGIDHIGVNGSGRLSLTGSQASALDNAGIDFVNGANVTMLADASDAASFAVASLDRLNVDHIDVSGNGLATISDARAQDLLNAGIDFADADIIRVQAAGTHLETSLKGLQQLHVDMVAATGTLVVEAGEGGLGALSASGLPQFDIAQHESALDVTLNINPGSIGSGFDLASIANALADAGVDHIGVNGAGTLGITQAQASAIDNAHLDFANGANVTILTDAAGAATLNSVILNRLNIDHIDVAGSGALTISDSRAGELLGAGVDFVESDNITVYASGTHLSTTMKGLQQLHVDSVAATGVLAVNVGEGGLAGLAAAGLPQFDVVQSDAALDVTLNVGPGELMPGDDLSIDLGAFGDLANALRGAGVDHLGVVGGGALSLSYHEAAGLDQAHINFTEASDVTVHAASFAELDIGLLGRLNVDHIETGGVAQITDAQAAGLIAAGVDFAMADNVTVNAGGTHLSTSLKDLQTLHVDAVQAAAGQSVLHLDAGDLSQVNGTGLPQFDVAQSDGALDVTLNVDIRAVDDLERLAGALRAAGVDHFALAQQRASIDADILARLDLVATESGIDFVYGATPAGGGASGFSLLSAVDEQTYDHGRVYQEILTSFEAADEGAAANIEIADGAAAALVESGMLRAYLSDHLVIDATSSGDRLLTTLKEVADIGIDEIRTAGQQGAPVYVDLGITGDGAALEEIKALFKNLDVNFDGPDRLFSGSEKVALVVDAPVAEAISHVDGGFEQLAELGFTEIDVLAAPDGFALDTHAIEVKVIGQQDELYDYLHHNR